MRASSNVKPSGLFEIENNEDMSTILFYPEYPNFEEVTNEEGVVQYEYDLHRLEVLKREGLRDRLELQFEEWLRLAKEKENEISEETESEKIFRLEKENQQLGIEISEREINEIIQGMQISELEIRLLEIQLGGM